MASSKQGRHAGVHKRIIVCCDGTWQDGTVVDHPWQSTNILKIARLIAHVDDTHDPPIPQVVFYQSGIGSEKNWYSKYVQGGTGGSLAVKVHEAYAFIAHNYQPGDEIFLFGFSRGAYTARMVAAFIGEIGILDRQDMNHFENIYKAFQTHGSKEKAQNNKAIPHQCNIAMAKGRQRADLDGDGFSIKCVGVFDTVGSLGLPKELTFLSNTPTQVFLLNDNELGSHIHHAFHAMALNEMRVDFTVIKFRQNPRGKEKGQVLKQVWFAGEHSDIGGGWRSHDLSDVALAWMVSQFEGMLAIDRNYLCRLPNPSNPKWGAQLPHYPATGMFKYAFESQRPLPKKTDEITHEYVHPSVLEQSIVLPELRNNINANPSLVVELCELEQIIKKEWPSRPPMNPHPEGQEAIEAKLEATVQRAMKKYLENQVQSKDGRTSLLGTIVRGTPLLGLVLSFYCYAYWRELYEYVPGWLLEGFTK